MKKRESIFDAMHALSDRIENAEHDDLCQYAEDIRAIADRADEEAFMADYIASACDFADGRFVMERHGDGWRAEMSAGQASPLIEAHGETPIVAASNLNDMLTDIEQGEARDPRERHIP